MLKSTNATPSPVPLLLPHASSRPTPPPAPFFLPSHAANRHSGHPDVHSSVWNQSMIDFKQINASADNLLMSARPRSFEKFCTFANAVSLLENRHFLSHRPQQKLNISSTFLEKFLTNRRAQRGNFSNIFIDFLKNSSTNRRAQRGKFSIILNFNYIKFQL